MLNIEMSVRFTKFEYFLSCFFGGTRSEHTCVVI